MITTQTNIPIKETRDQLTAVEFNELNTNFNLSVDDLDALYGSITTLQSSISGLALLSLGETNITAYPGDQGKIAYDHAQTEHQTIIDGSGLVVADGKSITYDNTSYEIDLGNPTTDGQILSSTTLGVRSWIDAPTGGTVDITYPEAGIPISTGTGWSTSLIDNSANWNTAYGWGDHSGLYSVTAHTHDYQPSSLDLTSIDDLVGTTGFLKKTDVNTWTLDTREYLDSSDIRIENWDTAYSWAADVATIRDKQPILTLGADVVDALKTKVLTSTPITQTLSSSYTLDLTQSQIYILTLSADITLLNPTSFVQYAYYSLEIHQNSAGAHKLSWGSYFKFPNGEAPTLSLESNAYDMFSIYAKSATEFIVTYAQNFR